MCAVCFLLVHSSSAYIVVEFEHKTFNARTCLACACTEEMLSKQQTYESFNLHTYSAHDFITLQLEYVVCHPLLTTLWQQMAGAKTTNKLGSKWKRRKKNIFISFTECRERENALAFAFILLFFNKYFAAYSKLPLIVLLQQKYLPLRLHFALM